MLAPLSVLLHDAGVGADDAVSLGLQQLHGSFHGGHVGAVLVQSPEGLLLRLRGAAPHRRVRHLQRTHNPVPALRHNGLEALQGDFLSTNFVIQPFPRLLHGIHDEVQLRGLKTHGVKILHLTPHLLHHLHRLQGARHSLCRGFFQLSFQLWLLISRIGPGPLLGQVGLLRLQFGRSRPDFALVAGAVVSDGLLLAAHLLPLGLHRLQRLLGPLPPRHLARHRLFLLFDLRSKLLAS
mmetsp:Transcript_15048/g.45484  ORF Transcript_15048/g.45484 Transcript_15048/m.45484 type:complete len:237 (+) Transcript_15048:305-1015(+)